MWMKFKSGNGIPYVLEYWYRYGTDRTKLLRKNSRLYQTKKIITGVPVLYRYWYNWYNWYNVVQLKKMLLEIIDLYMYRTVRYVRPTIRPQFFFRNFPSRESIGVHFVQFFSLPQIVESYKNERQCIQYYISPRQIKVEHRISVESIYFTDSIDIHGSTSIYLE